MVRPRKNTAASRPKTVSFRLPDDLMADMRKLAKHNRRTLSGEVQIAMEQHLHSNGFAHADGKKTTTARVDRPEKSDA